MSTVLVAVLTLAAASHAKADALEVLLENLTIQQSTDAKVVAKPALFQYVAKKDAPDVWVVNLGLKLDALAVLGLSWADQVELGPSLDYQRNTAADKKQDAFKVGLDAEINAWRASKLSATPVVYGTANYVRDGIKEVSGMQAKSSVTLVMNGCDKKLRCIWRPQVITDLGSVARFTYTPLIGIEYDHALKAESSSDEGYVVRTVPRLVATLFVLPCRFDHRVELMVDLSARRDLFGSLADGWHPLTKVSLNLYLYNDEAKKKSAGVGLDWINGDDPDAKFEDQELLQASFKVKL